MLLLVVVVGVVIDMIKFMCDDGSIFTNRSDARKHVLKPFELNGYDGINECYPGVHEDADIFITEIESMDMSINEEYEFDKSGGFDHLST